MTTILLMLVTFLLGYVWKGQPFYSQLHRPSYHGRLFQNFCCKANDASANINTAIETHDTEDNLDRNEEQVTGHCPDKLDTQKGVDIEVQVQDNDREEESSLQFDFNERILGELGAYSLYVWMYVCSCVYVYESLKVFNSTIAICFFRLFSIV